jgi:hypothetical protein
MNAIVVATHVWAPDQPTPQAVEVLDLDWGGPLGDRHHGLTMRSDTRQKSVFARGTEIRNHRQVSLVDMAELADVAAALGIESLPPGLIADNICTSGITGLTDLPRMTRLVFASGAVVMLGGENMPCTIAGGLVAGRYAIDPAAFPKAALGRRGVTGWVEHPGTVRPGDSLQVIPPSRGA